MKRDNSYLLGNKFALDQGPNRTSFKKGMTPWNKGTKGVMKINSGTFYKGQKSIRWKPVGTITVRHDKCGTLRRWIKTNEPNVWIEFAKHIWLKSGKSLINGFCLHHVNNDSLDDRIENLIQISRIEHPKVHNRWNTKNITAKRLSQEVFNFGEAS